MKEKAKRIYYIFAALFALVVMIISGQVNCPLFSLKANADISDNNLETTYISEDLSDIDPADYPKDINGRYRVIRFQEYCYSEKPFFSQYYGLYFYLYNPTEKEIIVDHSTVNMAVAYNNNGEPSSYEKLSLKFCDKTANNRFYKFKILSSMNNTTLLKTAQDYASKHDGKRRYDIAGIELYYKNFGFGTNAIDGEYAQTYYYSGYAAGCGDSNESTLTATVKPLVTLNLEPHATTYRPEGHNAKNEYTQDSLHSVWFSVPNNIIKEYGEMTAVKATWLNAVLKPCLVTGNFEAYNCISNYLGVSDIPYEDIGALNQIFQKSELPYAYLSNFGATDDGEFFCFDGYTFNWYIRSNLTESLLTSTTGIVIPNNWENINPLELIFWTELNTVDSADSYIVSSEKILNKARERSQKLGNTISGANGNYSKSLFESVDEAYTTLEITAGVNKDLVLDSFKVGDSWWDKLWGKEYNSPFDNVNGIYKVTASDMSLENSELSKKLYVSPSDIADLRKEFNEKSNTESIYLLRYQVSDYISQEASCMYLSQIDIPLLGEKWSWSEQDTNAYFFQETVNLNFDVIQVTCSKESVETIIPVVSNPIDIFPEATPPLDTTTDMDNEWWFKNILAILGLIVILVILSPIITPILTLLFAAVGKGIGAFFDALLWIISLPLNIVVWIFSPKD